MFDIFNYIELYGMVFGYKDTYKTFNTVEDEDFGPVKLLLKDTDADNDAAFRAAVKQNNLDMVKYLLEQGAYARAENDYALIHAATHLENWDMVKCLLEHGAYVRADNDAAFRAAVKQNNLDMVKYLLEQGAYARAENDYALIHAATHLENWDMVKCLLEHGSYIHARNDAVLGAAVEQNNLDMMKYLSEYIDHIYMINNEEFNINSSQDDFFLDVNNTHALEINNGTIEHTTDESL